MRMSILSDIMVKLLTKDISITINDLSFIPANIRQLPNILQINKFPPTKEPLVLIEVMVIHLQFYVLVHKLKSKSIHLKNHPQLHQKAMRKAGEILLKTTINIGVD